MTEIMLDKQETLNEIGTKIRKLRESKNLSIQEFADKLEMEYNNVIRIEKGRTNYWYSCENSQFPRSKFKGYSIAI